jgi:peptidoglycan-associated lipoprotein
MWVIGYGKIAQIAKPAAISACILFAAGCAMDNKPPLDDRAPAVAAAPAVPPGTPQDFFVNVGDRVFFNENSADLLPTTSETLEKQAAWLLRHANYSITVEGHSDEKGDKQRNMALANRRAQAVRSFLAARGVAPQRIKLVSYGRARRVANCNDISCWSQNRRVVVVLDAPGMAGPAAAPPSARPRG